MLFVMYAADFKWLRKRAGSSGYFSGDFSDTKCRADAVAVGRRGGLVKISRVFFFRFGSALDRFVAPAVFGGRHQPIALEYARKVERVRVSHRIGDFVDGEI